MSALCNLYPFYIEKQNKTSNNLVLQGCILFFFFVFFLFFFFCCFFSSSFPVKRRTRVLVRRASIYEAFRAERRTYYTFRPHIVNFYSHDNRSALHRRDNSLRYQTHVVATLTLVKMTIFR